jgi:hypothetical protein
MALARPQHSTRVFRRGEPADSRTASAILMTYYDDGAGAEALKNLRTEIDVGIRELDAGLGEELDLEEFLRELNEEHRAD